MVGLPPRQGLAPKGQGAGIGVRLLEEPQVRLPLLSALSPTPTLHPALLRPNWALRRWVNLSSLGSPIQILTVYQ